MMVFEHILALVRQGYEVSVEQADISSHDVISIKLSKNNVHSKRFVDLSDASYLNIPSDELIVKALNRALYAYDHHIKNKKENEL